jgi:hypothetical protein
MGVTGIDTGGALDGFCWPAVVTVAVGETDAEALAATPTAIVTGGKLPPGWTLADVVQVTCWPLVVQFQPSPVAEVTVGPAGTVKT